MKKNMKTTNKYIALAAVALTFAACTQDNDIIPQGDADAVKITATIGKLQTRVSYDERNTTFDVRSLFTTLIWSFSSKVVFLSS